MAAKTTLLVDADIVAYQLAFKSQRSYDFGDGEGTAMALDSLEDLHPRIDDYIATLCETLKTNDVVICLSCPTSDNFRLGVYPDYKGNRDPSRKPLYLEEVKRYLEEHYPSYRRPHLEADDIMGILSTHPGIINGKKIIVSEDKDMKTIPGWLYNPGKDSRPWKVDEREADYWHLHQTLTGDRTDHYPGCPRAGDKASMGTLGAPGAYLYDTVQEAWRKIVLMYEAKGLTEEHALTQARCARILRASDYDFTNKAPILWTPPAV